ncbi:MAG: C4-type zinc ribbon domain-containing protein [Micropruina sp.]|uniref:zinc ribbon domain-containing protein n=1 Tax=Micropruina sp. TaxID=2737536 RepID=UPI0039E216E8
MQAAATAQSRLLALQSVDTAIAQLEHRRRSLPELAQIAEKQQVRRRQGEQLIAANTAVSDLELEVAKAEDDLVPVRQRLERDQQRVNSGAVTDPKQLNALLEEIEHLKRRIGDLEDVELELMESLEQATATRDEVVATRAEGETELRALLAARDEQLTVLDAELAERNAERAGVASEIPSELLALYDRIRAKSGSGAAALVRRRCSGCQLEATAADLTRYRAAPPDEVLRCEECNRILVRTAESGL